MKTQPNILLRLLVLSTLLLAVSPQINSPADAAELRLSSESLSNQLTLRWIGALGVKLQQATNLANPVWQDVPNSDGMSAMQFSMTNAAVWFRLKGSGTDADGDVLDGWFEELGWDIAIDKYGYGTDGLVIRHVTSNPGLADTDGDGIDDFWEWVLGTDPRMADTDGDSLSDYEEWFRWHTSPTSVDTDGDARGPNHNLPPKAQLFDGNELSLLHTSPTLEDTDGDGRTDYEEYDQPGRSPLVAQLPKLEVQLVDAVDVRLDVEYAEELGTAHEYGAELALTTAQRQQFSAFASMNFSVTVGAEGTAAIGFADAKFKAEATIGGEAGVGFESETSRSVERSYSDYATDSRTRTETAASGSMSGGIRLINSGPVTYTTTDLGLTVRYLQPPSGAGTAASFKTLATLVPALGANGITLAPGGSTPVLQVQATGLNASRVKEFMARPNSLYLEPAFYEIENAEGLNFDFLEEVTRWRTARLEIDYGNGTNEEFRVATNVERNEDGSYAGVTMGMVMSNILHIPFQTVPARTLQPTNATNERVLYSVRDVETWTNASRGHWVVMWSGEDTRQAHPDFEDIVLKAGDQLLLVFAYDQDGDGLFAPEEQHFGTDDGATPDSDLDGLDDVFEAHTGWDVVLPTRTYHVFSDPAQADQDGDGLTDAEEFQKGTDPTRPDTDEDGLADGLDSHPLVPAKVLRVKWDAVPGGTNGATWATALTSLQDALSLARAGQATTNNSADDVAEIWVAAGVYKPTTTTTNRNATFRLVRNTALYGGFSGVETKLSQRNADPLFNGTVLSGDLWNNDASIYGDDTNSFADNSHRVCFTDYAEGSGSVLDGFTITGGNAKPGGYYSYFGGGLLVAAPGEGIEPGGPPPRLKNLLFRANHASIGAGLNVDPPGLVISDCLFLQNSAEYVGGGMQSYSSSGTILTNCQFIQNETRLTNAIGGGGLFVEGPGLHSVDRCVFSLNTSKSPGGAIGLSSITKTRISRSRFLSNTGTRGGGLALDRSSFGWSEVEVLQSVFVGNSGSGTGNPGGAIYTHYGGSGSSVLYLINSSFSLNSAPGGGGAIFNNTATILIENCASWGNPGGFSGYVLGSRVRTTCGDLVASWPGNGNINADPKFVNAATGDLRLDASSPCVDAGNNYIDYYPTVPGFQLLPATDLDGNWRVVDGNHDGTVTVDMGAYENQGQ